MNNNKSRIIVCVPAYNEEKNIGPLIIRILNIVDQLIVCDDGSADLTSDIAERLGAIVVKHEKNMGYGTSIQTLFSKAFELNADIVVTIDGDGQHNPAEIPLLINALLDSDADVVIGSRFITGGGTDAPKWRENGKPTPT